MYHPGNYWLINYLSGKLTVFSVFGGEEEKPAEQPVPVRQLQTVSKSIQETNFSAIIIQFMPIMTAVF